MKLIPIRVECHSGYKADEYPICFYREKIRFEISEISDRWYQSRPSPEWAVADYFKVITTVNSHFILKHEINDDQWFLVTTDEPAIRFNSG